MTYMDLAGGEPNERGAENELRLRRRLWRDAGALRALREIGLTDVTIRRFRLGMNEPNLTNNGRFTERAVTAPVLRPDGSRSGRWTFLNLEGLTREPVHDISWSAGGSRSFYSRAVTSGSTLLLVADIWDVLLLWQTIGEALPDVVVMCSTIVGEPPSEWRDRQVWRDWSRIVVGAPERKGGADLAKFVTACSGREVLRCAPPNGESWADVVRLGGSVSEISRIIAGAKPFVIEATAAVRPDGGDVVGDFDAVPICVEGALVKGLLHYPITMERRAYEDRGAGGPMLVQHYVTRILRSDGALLDIERLPAPHGTPEGGRVLALSDGTRILSEPRPGRFGTWRFESMTAFMAARAGGTPPACRSLHRLLADVEGHLRAHVRLPHDEHYALASLVVVGTFVHRAFATFPILMVNGPRGSGKSEFGQAMAAVACNAVLVGRITAAGLVRLLAESRGLVVLDDLEAVGRSRGGTDDISQILKVSYKAATARRVLPGRDGRVEVLDFFAPKIVTNISGADPVLASRMLTIQTRAMPAAEIAVDHPIDPSALRDELHVWSMCEVSSVVLAYAAQVADVHDRHSEIAAPLRALASLGGEEWSTRLEAALSLGAPEPAEPESAVLDRALRTLVDEGCVEVAMPRLLLEMALQARGPFLPPSAESLGRMLIVAGARDRTDAVERRRLHGEVTRVYGLSSTYIDAIGRPARPVQGAFDFCSSACAACRYDAVCESVVPWLRQAHSRRFG